MPKFMLLKHYAEIEGVEPITTWDPTDVKAHINFMREMSEELTATGEFVDAQGLSGPELAKIVTFKGEGAPVITDGPYLEAKEFLAGFWVVDVDSEERALELAAKASAAPGPNGKPLGERIEVREVMSAPPTEL